MKLTRRTDKKRILKTGALVVNKQAGLYVIMCRCDGFYVYKYPDNEEEFDTQGSNPDLLSVLGQTWYEVTDYTPDDLAWLMRRDDAVLRGDKSPEWDLSSFVEAK